MGAPSAKAYNVVQSWETIEAAICGPWAALSVANNHVYDAGSAAFRKMLEGLQRNGQPIYFGTRKRPHASLSVGGRRVAVIGCMETSRVRGPLLFREEDVAGHVKHIRSEFDLVVVTPHWGKEAEYAFHPSPGQRRLARSWIDAGADAVLGHHSHTIQGCEVYQGKPIYYSLGNLLFDHEEGRRFPQTRLGLIVRWVPSAEHDSWEHEFLFQEGNHVHILSENQNLRQASQAHLDRISRDLHELSWWRWARLVGRVYIRKSLRAWIRRLKRHPLATVPLWLGWNLMPRTVLLRLGAWFPDPDLQAIQAEARRLVVHVRSELVEHGGTAADI